MTAQLDRWERALEHQMAAAPYVLLVASTVLSLFTDGLSWVVVGLVGLAAVWLLLMPRGPVYVAGLVALIATLGAQNLWFASFFGFVGFLHSWRHLTGMWRVAGVAATAVACVTSYNGGLPDPTPTGILTYLFFTAAIIAAVVLFSFLGDVTAERGTERHRMVTRLESALRENEGLQAQLLVQAREAGVHDERQRMAAEIHDTLAQSLTGIVTQLQAARRGEGWERHVDIAIRLARESLAEARRSVHALGPGQLESTPLPEALEDLVRQWGEVRAVRADLTATGTVRPLHQEVEQTLLRVAQEALANAARHADASRVGVTLSYMEDVVTLDVRDDGAGFDPERAQESGGFGLTAMRRRVSRMAGELEIESEPGGGTAVSASLPAVAARV